MTDLRIKTHRRGTQVALSVNGIPVKAYSGETVFAVLLAEGIRALRHPVKKNSETARGGFCGMGVCQECRVTIDGVPDRRACMTEVRQGMEVVTDGR
ncbi:MAG: (2Fe-2S)-binding protein [Desulfobacterales bacterium]|jgi:sarcosine oxidase subunit alpha|nr:(2Fe-2S)-binding protein [Desulfobacterales bacterium]